MTVLGIAAAPLANASEDGIELMPRVEGVEVTHYVRDTGTAVSSSDEFYAKGTSGISPQ
jgi:hypothetical protein